MLDKVSIIEVAGNTISQTHSTERITYTRTQINVEKKNKDGIIFEYNKSGKIELNLKFEQKKTKMNFGFFTALQGGYIVI